MILEIAPSFKQYSILMSKSCDVSLLRNVPCTLALHTFTPNPPNKYSKYETVVTRILSILRLHFLAQVEAPTYRGTKNSNLNRKTFMIPSLSAFCFCL